MTPPYPLRELADWLERRLGRERGVPTLWRDAEQQVHRLLLALEPQDLPPAPQADALFLHRPFALEDGYADLGVLASHDGFDHHLTTGFNVALARRLDWQQPRRVRLEEKTVGLRAELPEPQPWSVVLERLEREFGGLEGVLEPADLTAPLERLALMSSFRPQAVQVAAQTGAQLYLTGQLRLPGQGPARAHGLGVVALGHRRSELWGLGQLARELRAAFDTLEVQVCGLP